MQTDAEAIIRERRGEGEEEKGMCMCVCVREGEKGIGAEKGKVTE